jgi:hypothetical protein
MQRRQVRSLQERFARTEDAAARPLGSAVG